MGHNDSHIQEALLVGQEHESRFAIDQVDTRAVCKLGLILSQAVSPVLWCEQIASNAGIRLSPVQLQKVAKIHLKRWRLCRDSHAPEEVVARRFRLQTQGGGVLVHGCCGFPRLIS